MMGTDPKWSAEPLPLRQPQVSWRPVAGHILQQFPMASTVGPAPLASSAASVEAKLCSSSHGKTARWPHRTLRARCISC